MLLSIVVLLPKNYENHGSKKQRGDGESEEKITFVMSLKVNDRPLVGHPITRSMGFQELLRPSSYVQEDEASRRSRLPWAFPTFHRRGILV